jgi:crotonobetainyl-CoA:carnitine CoA-transferase CaiB-like acyl-CoA transferase
VSSQPGTRPLEGLLVVAMEQAVSAPLASRHLGDLGARVIKIERPDGGDFTRDFDTLASGLGAHFTWANRGKESLTLDVKAPPAREVLDRLLDRADVFLHNLAPGASGRLGLDGPTLTTRFPRLISCGISGYGAAGPWRGRRAYDLLVQAEAAVATVTGSLAGPVKPGIAVADIAAAMYAYSSVLAALLNRGRTGTGCVLDIAMLDAVAEWMGYALTVVKHGGEPQLVRGMTHPAIAPYDAYDTLDGRLVALSVQNDREWRRLAIKVLDRPELADDPRYATNQARVAQRGDLDAILSEFLAGQTLDEAIHLLDAAGIACGRVNDVAALVNHPALSARERWATIDSPVGTIPTLLPPGPSTTWTPRLGAVPALGEHTDAVLRELGYDDDAIHRLRADGTV